MLPGQYRLLEYCTRQKLTEAKKKKKKTLRRPERKAWTQSSKLQELEKKGIYRYYDYLL